MNTYEEIREHRCDFVVSYLLYPPEDGGRILTYQHLRCDFMYEGDDPKTDGIYMIHPEFLGGDGKIVEEQIQISLSGKALMWICIPEMRDEIHKHRVKVGTRGFFVEGTRKIGEVVVTNIVDMFSNHS